MATINDKVIQLEKKLTDLLNKKSYYRLKRACGGKWRGTYDYRLVFEDETYIFISNGLKSYEYNLNVLIGEIEYFNSNKNRFEQWIKQVLEVNSRNDAVNYVFENLYMVTNSGYLGYIVFDYHFIKEGIKSETHTYVESNLSCYCKSYEFNEAYAYNMLKEGFPLEKMAFLKSRHHVFS